MIKNSNIHSLFPAEKEKGWWGGGGGGERERETTTIFITCNKDM